MIGTLPTTLEIGGKSYSIRSDYRVVLNIYRAFNDPELTDGEKCYVCLKCLFTEPIPKEHLQETAEKAFWFVGGGDVPQENVRPIKVLDWEQDEGIIFPAVNKCAGYEVRSVPYLHWWTFLGFFNELGEGLFSEVIAIRSKLGKGKKLDKREHEFYRAHRKMIDLRVKKTAEELAEERQDKDFLDKLLSAEGGG